MSLNEGQWRRSLEQQPTVESHPGRRVRDNSEHTLAAGSGQRQRDGRAARARPPLD